MYAVVMRRPYAYLCRVSIHHNPATDTLHVTDCPCHCSHVMSQCRTLLAGCSKLPKLHLLRFVVDLWHSLLCNKLYNRSAANRSNGVRSFPAWATFLPLIAWVYLLSNFRDELRKRHNFAVECGMAVQGHPRSLIWVAIESADETSYSIVTLALSRTVSEIRRILG